MCHECAASCGRQLRKSGCKLRTACVGSHKDKDGHGYSGRMHRVRSILLVAIVSLPYGGVSVVVRRWFLECVAGPHVHSFAAHV